MVTGEQGKGAKGKGERNEKEGKILTKMEGERRKRRIKEKKKGAEEKEKAKCGLKRRDQRREK